MEIRPLKWKSKKSNKIHLVVEVSFDTQDIENARQIVHKKIDYVDVHSPAGVEREEDVIKCRLLAGKLADHAVKYAIEQSIGHYASEHKVIEYDLIRTDQFKNPDPFDLAVQFEQNELVELEVRSSFCYKLGPLSNIINKFSSYGFYTTRTKPNEPKKDIYWQVVFYNVPYDLSGDEDRIEEINIFEDDIESGNLKAYIVGGGARALFESEIACIRPDQDGAFYYSLSPITEGKDCSKLINETLQLSKYKIAVQENIS